LDGPLLALDRLFRLFYIRYRLLNFEIHLMNRILVVHLRRFELGMRLLHAAISREAVEYIPRSRRAEKPAVNHIAEIIRRARIAEKITAIRLDPRLVAGELNLDVLDLGENLQPLHFQKRTPL